MDFFTLPRKVERALWMIGLLLLVLAGWQLISYSAFQWHPGWFSWGRSSGDSQIAGRLKIQRLGMSVLVLNGDDSHTLSLAAGLVTGTTPVGGDGNTVIAGHRDIAFRALREIKKGDVVDIEADRTYSYLVDNIRIVTADDVSVLESDGKAKLTLITCYPFNYMGDAPERYVVEAKLIRRS